MKLKYFHKIDLKKIDYVILTIMTLLICSGLYCIYQIDLVKKQLGKAVQLNDQILGCILGFLVIIVILFFDYRFICRLSPLLYLGVVGLLAFTLKFGVVLNKVRRWVNIAGVSFQPSELAKIVLIVFLAYLCFQFKDKNKKFYPFFILAFLTMLPIGLILLEPHLSPCIVIIFIFCVIVLISGISYKVLITIMAVSLPIVATLIIGVGVFKWNLPFIQDYQVNRILGFQSDDEKEETDSHLQQNQSVEAIRSGGSYGKALSKDKLTRNYPYIYAIECDFIFAAVGEEYGFIGSFIIITLYFILILRCLKIAAHAPDLMGRIICTAVSALFMFQAFINIAVATQLIPTTGMPLPLISSGLTSLVSSMIAIGLVLDIGMQSR